MNREQIKDAILDMYPDVVINNELFFNEDVLKDFSLEDIAYKLSSLIYGDNLKHSLYGEERKSRLIRDMIKYIVVNNIDYFSLGNKELFDRENILNEYERLYKSKEFSLDDLEDCDKNNILNNSDVLVRNIDLFYYNEFMMIQKLYGDGKIKFSDINSFKDFNISLLKKITVLNTGNYDVRYDKYINELISYFVMGNISLNSLYERINSPSDCVKGLLIIAKFGVRYDSLNKIPLEVIGALNGKKIKRLYNTLNDRFDVGKYFDNDVILTIIINMCSLLGDEVVDKIIKHLPDNDVSVVRMFNCFYQINLNGVLVKDNKIVYNDDFIRFFVGDNLGEPNSLLNSIYDDRTDLGNNIEEIYYYWEELDKRFKEQKLFTRMAFLKHSFEKSRVVLDPDEYKLEGTIVNSYYDNRKYLDGIEPYWIINEVRSIYKMMRHEYQKTIPYVRGEYDGYSYEMLRANDPSLFEVGALCDCCFKIGGDADSFVRYCATDKNARVLCIKEDDRIVAMVPMVRNGNLLLCNSIESNYVKDYNFMRTMFEILEQASDRIIKISTRSESSDTRLGAVLVSNYKNDIKQFGKYKAILSEKIDSECLLPLKEDIYTNMGGIECGNFLVYCADDFEYWNSESFDPDVIYEDPRRDVLELESEYITDGVKKKINSIYYESKQKKLEFDNAEKVIFNDDWFIFIDNRYQIISEIVGSDFRAMMEYFEYLKLEYEYCSHYDMDGNIKYDAKYR